MQDFIGFKLEITPLMKCPFCQNILHHTDQVFHCDNNHSFIPKNGVYDLMNDDFKAELNSFLISFEDWRKPFTESIDDHEFEKLPYVDHTLEIWKLRQLDIKLIEKHLPSIPKKALDLGSWNGWLANHLTKMGFETTAVDYFRHEKDGLEAKKFYRNDWLSLQMNLNDLSLLDEKYDLIVVNRCLNYLVDIEQTLENLKNKLNPGGVLLISGLSYFRNPTKSTKELERANEEFRLKYKRSIQFGFKRKFLTSDDLQMIIKLGFKIEVYSGLKLKSAVAKILRQKPSYYYAIYQA